MILCNQFLQNVENRVQIVHMSDNFDDINNIAIFLIQNRCEKKLTCFNYKVSAEIMFHVSPSFHILFIYHFIHHIIL